MRVYKKRNKNILIKICSFALLATLGASLLLPADKAYALEPGCYVTTQGTNEPSNCPQKDSSGNDIDPDKCYFAAGGSGAISSFVEKNCDGSSSSGSTSNSGSNSYCSTNPAACAPLNPGGSVNNSDGTDGKQCGKGEHTVTLSINIGCRGDAYPGPNDVNPIIDMAFALFRFLSLGVGVVVVGSIVVAGIQYTASRGNPQATEASIKRVTSSVLALILYMFIFAIANFLVPGGLLIQSGG
jgi:hypothetical protein